MKTQFWYNIINGWRLKNSLKNNWRLFLHNLSQNNKFLFKKFFKLIFLFVYCILKTVKQGVYKELKLTKPVKNRNMALDWIVNSSKAYAYIMTRNFISDTVLSFGRKLFYSPPVTHESTLFLDFIAIAVQKNFKHMDKLNKL